MPAIDPETARNTLLTALGYVAAVAGAIGTTVGGVAKIADWRRKKRETAIERAYAMDDDDVRTAVHASPAGTADDWMRRYAEADERATRAESRAKRLQEAVDALRESLADLRTKMVTQQALEADIERMHGEVSKAHREADERVARVLREDLDPALQRVRELEEQNAAILSGNSRPVNDEPPDLRRSQRPTPITGTRTLPGAAEVVVPRLVPIQDCPTPRPSALPPRPVKR